MDQRICKLCMDHLTDAIMLVCAHQLCYHCALRIQVLDTTSLIQGKYHIQCPVCRRQTYTYELQNLLIDTMELNLITDRSEVDCEQLQESQLSHNAMMQPDAIFQRRVSKIIDRQQFCYPTPSSNQISKPKAIPMTPTNQPIMFHNPNSEKVSPSRTPQIKSKKQSQQFDSSFDLDERTILNTSQNQNLQLKAISGISTPNKPPFACGFTGNKTNETFMRFGERTNHDPIEIREKENAIDIPKHKRASTGVPQSSATDEIVQTQIISSYFAMLQKNITLLQQDLISKVQNNKQCDANFLYTRLKRLSEKQKGRNEEDLIQQIKVIHELRSELTKRNDQDQGAPSGPKKSANIPKSNASKPQYLQSKLL